MSAAGAIRVMLVDDQGLETVAELRRRHPGQAIVLCSASVDPAMWEEARRAGVSACVSKEDFFSLPDVVRGLVPAA